MKSILGVLILLVLLLGGCSNPLLETVDQLIDEYKAVLAGEQPEINVKWGAVNIWNGKLQELGNVDQEWPEEFEFTIENTGAGTLHLTDSPQVALSGGSYSVIGPQPLATIAPGGSAEFTIELDPGDAAGNPSVVVTIANDDPDESDYQFTLSADAGKYQGIKTVDSGNDVGQYSSIGVHEANVYIAYFDGKGNFQKPFVLPQKDPRFYHQFFKSYNIPEFLIKPVNYSPHDFLNAIKTSTKKTTFSR